jgi:hypothetical protein
LVPQVAITEVKAINWHNAASLVIIVKDSNKP